MFLCTKEEDEPEIIELIYGGAKMWVDLDWVSLLVEEWLVLKSTLLRVKHKNRVRKDHFIWDAPAMIHVRWSNSSQSHYPFQADKKNKPKSMHI